MGGKGSGRRPKGSLASSPESRFRGKRKTQYERLAWACEVASRVVMNEKLVADLQEAKGVFESLQARSANATSGSAEDLSALEA